MTVSPVEPRAHRGDPMPEDAKQWTARLRGVAVRALPPERLLPDRQPAYVASWVYVFGVLTLSALSIVILTGCVLAIKGPTWWHVSTVGLFVNSLHLWSVEAFFFFMVIHLWGKFFMAAWRGRRRLTWVTGVVSFAVSIAAAFTGYLSQQNFDSEWISTQAKDGINSTGAGAFFNVLDFGQMLMWHIVLLPLVVALLVGLHVLLVRRRGVVPPFAQPDAAGMRTAAPSGSAVASGAPDLGGAQGSAATDVGVPDTRTRGPRIEPPEDSGGPAGDGEQGGPR